MPKGINNASYERLAKVAQGFEESEFGGNVAQVQSRLEDLVEQIDPVVPSNLDGVLENLTGIPIHQLTSNDFAPIFDYFDRMIKRDDVAEQTKEIFKELDRKLYYFATTDLHINIPSGFYE